MRAMAASSAACSTVGTAIPFCWRERNMTATAVIRAHGEGERLWFYGGGVFTIKASAAETGGSLFMFEDSMVQGKVTPLHLHPDEEEAIYVIEGELLVHVDGKNHSLARRPLRGAERSAARFSRNLEDCPGARDVGAGAGRGLLSGSVRARDHGWRRLGTGRLRSASPVGRAQRRHRDPGPAPIRHGPDRRRRHGGLID